MDKVYKLPKIAFPEVSGDTVSFYSEYDGLPLKKCEVAFAAAQSGTGDPSPENVRPIVGVDEITQTVNGVETVIDLDGTRYGGTVDLVSGLMTIDKKLINAKDQTWILQAAGVSVYTATDTDNSITIEYPTGRRPILSTAFVYSNNASLPNQSCGWGGGNNNKNLFVKYDNLTTSIENWTAFINANDIEFVYYIVPFTVQLTPAQIETIAGTNTIFADTGDTTVQYIRVY